MASLIEGYNYDIFISYRQKDNKYDGWVTAFTDHLKGELESTFKEEISLYFDINPHDGLLETHDVDASLKEKLKCLVFIPVISRTYCDPRAFAWEHEFKAFVELSSTDRLGLKVRLLSGNVASRILPVRIHELDDEDRIVLEKELGGTLRAIDFIYKEPGVNRPLTTSDDENKNLAGTNYRNQINKTANAVKEIISALKRESAFSAGTGKTNGQYFSRSGDLDASERNRIVKIRKKIMFSLLAFFICAAALFLLFENSLDNKTKNTQEAKEKTIAVLPFENMSDDKENDWFGNAMTDEIISQLNKIKELRVRSRTSVMRYKSINKSIPSIGKELNANYIIEGSTQTFRDQIRINVQLLDARKDEHLWGETFTGTWDDLLKMQAEIARQTVFNLKAVLTPEEKLNLEKDPTRNPAAYMNYLSANVLSDDALYFFLVGNKLVDSISFLSAIKMYDKAIENDPGFALAYARRAIARSWGYYIRQLDEEHIVECKNDIDSALSIDKDLVEAQVAMGFYYFYCLRDYHRALLFFKKASENRPESYQPLFYMAMVYRKMGEWTRSQQLVRKVIAYEPQDALILTNIGLSFNYLRDYDSAIIYHEKAIGIMPNWSAPYNNRITSILLKDGDVETAMGILDTAIVKTGEKLADRRAMLEIYEGKYENALKILNNISPLKTPSAGDIYLIYSLAYRLNKNQRMARTYSDSAIYFFGKSVVDQPDDPYSLGSLALAKAMSGDSKGSTELGRKAVGLAGSDYLILTDMQINMAKIWVINGDFEKAMKQVDFLLRNPSGFSFKLLQIDPVWKPLKERQEYKKIEQIFNVN